ncbi:MAG: peptidylprolyl isomerase [Ferruginibacter sp.]
MKKIFFLFAFACIAGPVFSQTLFTYGSTAVDKAEFIRAYNKNKTPVEDKEKALREYLDLYIKFKLKVKAATELRLDTLAQLQYDAQSFRTQIEETYLNNDKAVDDLFDEAFNRSQKDLHVLHFFVPVQKIMSPDDSLKAYKTIQAAYNVLNSGKAISENIVNGTIKVNQSDLGFITVFTLPYEYETIIYNLKPGQTSKPYRTKNGWHLFKLTEERKAVGKWKIAQILIAVPPNSTEAEKKLFEARTDSVYQLLAKGIEFGKLARQFSDDKLTYGNNGELAEFGSGKYNIDFENEVFKLKKDGEISKPFLSPYGHHILKRISQTPIASSKADKAYEFELRQKIQQDSRINIAKDMFVKEVLKQVNYKKVNSVSDADLFRYADSVIANPKSETGNVAAYPISNKTLSTFAKTKLTGKDWLDFIRTYKGSGELYKGEDNAALYEKFTTTSVINYYKNHLEDYNTEFRYQMDEFKDGNVLFEIMERNIWGKAASDNAGLQKQYNDNKSNYLWQESADIILFNCAGKTIADKAVADLQKGTHWKKIAETANNNIQADSGRFELLQLPIAVDPALQNGAISQPVANPADGTVNFIKLIYRYNAGLQRSFDEARGLVINDYQNMLEENWITELKKKYPVKINESVFKSLLK